MVHYHHSIDIDLMQHINKTWVSLGKWVHLIHWIHAKVPRPVNIISNNFILYFYVFVN
jgi:hypothetical protein